MIDLQNKGINVDIANLNSEISAKQAQIDNLDSEISTKQEQTDNLSSDKQTNLDKIASIDQITTIITNLDQNNNEISSETMANTIWQLRFDLNNAITSIVNYENENSILTIENEELKMEVETNTTSISDLQEQLSMQLDETSFNQ